MKRRLTGGMACGLCMLLTFAIRADDPINKLFVSVPDSGTSFIENSTLGTIFNHLRMIDGAKEWWALQNKKPNGSQPTEADLAGLIKNGFPTPPLPGRYVINPIGKNPEFSISLDQMLTLHTERGNAIKKQAEPQGGGYSPPAARSAQPTP